MFCRFEFGGLQKENTQIMIDSKNWSFFVETTKKLQRHPTPHSVFLFIVSVSVTGSLSKVWTKVSIEVPVLFFECNQNQVRADNQCHGPSKNTWSRDKSNVPSLRFLI